MCPPCRILWLRDCPILLFFNYNKCNYIWPSTKFLNPWGNDSNCVTLSNLGAWLNMTKVTPSLMEKSLQCWCHHFLPRNKLGKCTQIEAQWTKLHHFPHSPLCWHSWFNDLMHSLEIISKEVQPWKLHRNWRSIHEWLQD